MQEILGRFITSTESAATILALTQSIKDEEAVKVFLKSNGYCSAVTEIGGNSSYPDFQEKLSRAVINASVNCNVIKRIDREVHALLHAIEEAKRGFLIVSFSTNLALKISIVRKDHWIAVCMYGRTAGHTLTNHYRIGMGIMHI